MRISVLAVMAGTLVLAGCVTKAGGRPSAPVQPEPIDQALAQLVAPASPPSAPAVSDSAWNGGKTPIPKGSDVAPATDGKVVAAVAAGSAAVAETVPSPASARTSVDAVAQDPAAVLAQAIAQNTVQPAAPMVDPAYAVPAVPVLPQDPSQLASVRAGALPPPPIAERRIVTITGDAAVAPVAPRRAASVEAMDGRSAPAPIEEKLVNTRKVF